MLGEITDDVRRLYRVFKDHRTKLIGMTRMADHLRDQLAAKLKAEFQANHHPGYRERLNVDCIGCWDDMQRDPRHDWTDADWIAEAERQLKGS